MGEPYPPAQYRQQRKGIECNPAVHREAEAVDENAVDESSEFNGAGDNDVQRCDQNGSRYGQRFHDSPFGDLRIFPEIVDKDDTVYVPLLKAFIDEVNRAYTIDPTMPRKMVEYLIGISDYYKVVSQDSKRLTLIHSFNVHGTLNQPSQVKVSAISVPIVQLPTELIAMRFKTDSKNTIEMYLNNGWELSFRIHNASSKVEPSLKFDIQFMGMPATILTINCAWK